ncbi:TonB-dependent receptor plug domain-containing protein [Peristeroidobacter soli]|uniref:TonB-dependent receptor plug domain-containing protein n=1 Tax=Peristeroidobacter soli TaxID=2497877 RepID=UPI00101B622A|nr:TonB-dependent receptor [Peristeroidobacter soli]
MVISWKSTGYFLLLAVNLAASPASPAEQEERFSLRADIAPAREQSNELRQLTGYEADPGECGDVMLGPLPQGEYTGREAWLKLVETACRLKRPEGASGGTELFADMTECTCNFGFPRFARLQEDSMVVTTTSTPELGKYSPVPVVVINRRRIHETGAGTVPDLLRYISQTAFHRGSGYRASGAQYAELRGLGASYTLVMLNGRRTLGTAADLSNSAFDLSTIPISAVERVEISMDANSLKHGMDAIGGIVNIVLRDSVDPVLYVRYGSASGGASQSQAAISGGAKYQRGRISVFLDAQRWGELLGRERERWNDQDFTRFGGLDYRSTLATPPNVRSLDGANLPGLDAPVAAARLNPDTGMFDFVGGQLNSSSLRAYQSIVPDVSRLSMLVNGSLELRESTTVSLELLGFKRESELQLMPAVVAEATWGAAHPENPFGMPVAIDALLTGLPPMKYRYGTSSTRAVAAIEGPLGRWRYSAFVARSDERVDVSFRDVADPDAIARALQGDAPGGWLSIYSTVGRTAVPTDVFADMPATRYSADATHFHVSTQGSLGQLPAGKVMLTVGFEQRSENMDFDPTIDAASRDIRSRFVHLRWPLIGPAMNVPAAKDLTLLFGARRDDYSDIGSITRGQLGFVWSPIGSVKVHAATSQSFRPPSLVDMNQPRIQTPTQIYDPKRAEVTPVDVVLGGNRELRPSTGRSSSVAVSFQSDDGWRLSAEYWRVRVREQISALAASSLLAQEDSITPGRVLRDAPSVADEAANLPGKLLLLDISRANAGAATTEGVDLAAQREFQTRWGWLMPALQVTLTDEFKYGDQPSTRVRMENRLGVASELGTVPKQRAVASLSWENDAWRVSVHARIISSYRDRSDVTGQPLSQSVRGGAVWDVNIARRLGASNLRLMLGAVNALNREPPFAHAGGSLGYDASQSDLQMRQFYGTISGTF